MSDRVKLVLDVSRAVRDRIEKIQIATHAEDFAEVIRFALALYELAEQRTREGAKLIVRSEDGSESEIDFRRPLH